MFSTVTKLDLVKTFDNITYMEITISHDELLSLLSDKLGITITKLTIEEDSKLVGVLDNFISRFPTRTGYDKITVIKSLRELSISEKWFGGQVMGLGDAKDAIERWDEFRAFVRKNGRLPVPGHLYSSMK